MKERTVIKLSLTGCLAVLLAVALVVVGYILNIVAIIKMDLTTFTGTLALRGLGVIVMPLGSALGWFM